MEHSGLHNLRLLIVYGRGEMKYISDYPKIIGQSDCNVILLEKNISFHQFA